MACITTITAVSRDNSRSTVTLSFRMIGYHAITKESLELVGEGMAITPDDPNGIIDGDGTVSFTVPDAMSGKQLTLRTCRQLGVCEVMWRDTINF